jgi:hypothetical protein
LSFSYNYFGKTNANFLANSFAHILFAAPSTGGDFR